MACFLPALPEALKQRQAQIEARSIPDTRSHVGVATLTQGATLALFWMQHLPLNPRVQYSAARALLAVCDTRGMVDVLVEENALSIALVALERATTVEGAQCVARLVRRLLTTTIKLPFSAVNVLLLLKGVMDSHTDHAEVLIECFCALQLAAVDPESVSLAKAAEQDSEERLVSDASAACFLGVLKSCLKHPSSPELHMQAQKALRALMWSTTNTVDDNDLLAMFEVESTKDKASPLLGTEFVALSQTVCSEFDMSDPRFQPFFDSAVQTCLTKIPRTTREIQSNALELLAACTSSADMMQVQLTVLNFKDVALQLLLEAPQSMQRVTQSCRLLRSLDVEGYAGLLVKHDVVRKVCSGLAATADKASNQLEDELPIFCFLVCSGTGFQELCLADVTWPLVSSLAQLLGTTENPALPPVLISTIFTLVQADPMLLRNLLAIDAICLITSAVYNHQCMLQEEWITLINCLAEASDDRFDSANSLTMQWYQALVLATPSHLVHTLTDVVRNSVS
eukprot:m.5265 g.5265  ORF g.5265 m.5265 type:complete len:512 (+) comp4880_c0_seq1:97-1632(+)